VRRFVDSRQGDERVARPFRPQPMRCFLADASIDCQPAAHVSAKMRRRGASDESQTSPDSILTAQSASDDTERPEARFGELEQRWRSGIDVAVDEAHLRA